MLAGFRSQSATPVAPIDASAIAHTKAWLLAFEVELAKAKRNDDCRHDKALSNPRNGRGAPDWRQGRY